VRARPHELARVGIGAHRSEYPTPASRARPTAQTPTAPAPPWTRSVRPATGPAALNRSMPVMPVCRGKAPCSNGTPSGKGTACEEGTTTYSAGCRTRDRTAPRSTTRARRFAARDALPNAVDGPRSIAVGNHARERHAVAESVLSLLDVTRIDSGAATRIRTSPGSGSGRAACRHETCRAGPCFSYHAAFIQLDPYAGLFPREIPHVLGM